MFRIILLCLLTCFSSFMPLKQSESIVSEDHTQIVEKKTKENYFSGQDGVNFVASDFLSYDFGRIFYDYIKDFESPRTENLSYNRSYNPINYEFISDTPIGHVHLGGFSRNLFNGVVESGTWNNGIKEDNNTRCRSSVKVSVLPNTTYTLSNSGNRQQVVQQYGNNGTTIVSDSGWQNSIYSFTTSSDAYYVSFGWRIDNSTIIQPFEVGNVMFNNGSTSLPYEDYFTGVVQYSSLACYSFTLDKELLFNSQYNGNCYHYVLKFYSRNPNGRPLLFGVDSYVIPHLKWEDNQGNLYGDNFYVTSSMIFNTDLHYNLHNFVYSERSDDSYKPLLNCYVNNFNKEFSDDEYTLAFNTGYDDGYNNGNNYGYQRGYSQGVSDTIAGNSQAMTIFAGIMDVAFIPVNVFFLMFDYEVFGINIAGFVSGLITIAIVIILMRFIFGRKV